MLDVIFGVLLGVLLVVVGGGTAAIIALRRFGARFPFQPERESDPPLSAYKTLDEPPPATRVSLPVVAEPKKVCSECASFDLAGGQKIMAMNPAFQAAASLIPPWRMGRALKTQPNPEHVEIVAEIEAATDEERKATLRKRLETIPAEVPLEAEEQVEGRLLGLEWHQFGACIHHSELRAGTDTCDAWKVKVVS